MMVCILANILYVPADRVFMAIHMAVITEINVFGVEWFVSPHLEHLSTGVTLEYSYLRNSPDLHYTQNDAQVLSTSYYNDLDNFCPWSLHPDDWSQDTLWFCDPLIVYCLVF